MNLNTKFIASFLAVITLFLGVYSYTKAVDSQITICAKKSGLVYIIGDEFRRADCRKNDSLLSWNTTGVKGPKGDKGDTGKDAQHGAGNIAFYYNSGGNMNVLRTDGTVWQSISRATSSWTPQTFYDIPIPTSDIVVWELNVFLDKNGDLWINNGLNNGVITWDNIGHPPRE